jgi:hypothetical protein
VPRSSMLPAHTTPYAAELVKPGAYLTLRNAKVDMYRGSMRLVVDALGKVEESDVKGFDAKVRITGTGARVPSAGPASRPACRPCQPASRDWRVGQL